jgi:hypothetical protein
MKHHKDYHVPMLGIDADTSPPANYNCVVILQTVIMYAQVNVPGLIK